MNIKLLVHPWFWKDMYYDTKRGIKNLFKYFRIVWKMVPWDSHSIYMMLQFQIRILSSYIEKHGYEIEETKLPKIKNMKRCIEILDNIIKDNYTDICGFNYDYDITWTPVESSKKDGKYTLFEMGTTETQEQQENNAKALKNAQILEEKEMNELCDLLKESKTWWD